MYGAAHQVANEPDPLDHQAFPKSRFVDTPAPSSRSADPFGRCGPTFPFWRICGRVRRSPAQSRPPRSRKTGQHLR
jgi:hypothetical protein